MRIRELRRSDGERMAKIIRESLGYDVLPETIDEQISIIRARGTDRLFAAESDGGELMGYVQASDYISLYLGKMKNVMALAVAPEYQGKGTGSALIQAVEDWAKADGCRGVRLNSGMERTGAHEFYKHCGYYVRKEQKQFFKLFE